MAIRAARGPAAVQGLVAVMRAVSAARPIEPPDPAGPGRLADSLPSAFTAGAIIGTVGTLIGLGGSSPRTGDVSRVVAVHLLHDVGT